MLESAASLELNPEAARSRLLFLISYSNGLQELGDENSGWAEKGARATALLDAAQLALLLGDRKGTKLLAMAADAYLGQGLMYGYFLRSLVEIPTENNERLGSGPVQMLRRLSERQSESRDPAQDNEEDDTITRRLETQPLQQAYLLLAFLGNREMSGKYHELIRGRLEALVPHGAYPIGPLGLPLRHYLKMMQALLFLQKRDEESDYVVRAISLFRQAMDVADRSIGLARSNDYLWQRMLSPIEIVDFDSVGMLASFFSAVSQESRAQYYDAVGGFGPGAIQAEVAELLVLNRGQPSIRNE